MSNVAVVKTPKAQYPVSPPFNPPELYPEYHLGSEIDESNFIYPAVRDILKILRLDEEHFGEKNWNPFGDFINSGDKVVIKPNLVVDSSYLTQSEFSSAITHGSVIRPLVDYAYIATGEKGEILIADGPIDVTSFADTLKMSGILDTVNHLKSEHKIKIPLEVIDLRIEYLKKYKAYRFHSFEISLWFLKKLSGDPKGYAIIDLKDDSEFNEIYHQTKYLRSTQLARSRKEPKKHHKNGRHEYSISKTILDADVIINVPKLKTHKKTGNTLSLKNIIGVTMPRNWMPHYMQYYDGYSKSAPLRDKILKFLRSVPRINGVGCILARKIKGELNVSIGGSNPDNDTLWRSILDINKILFYADKDGKMHDSKQRKYFTLIDGVIGGENDAPLSPTPTESKILMGGFDPVAVDHVATKIMGFDYKKIKTMKNALEMKKYPLGINDVSKINIVGDELPDLHFSPAYNWREHIENRILQY